MKKYVLMLLVFFCFCLTFNISYAYKTSCENYIIKPQELSTNNLEKFLNRNKYYNVNYFCSYDKCYNVRENIHDSISNFHKLYDKDLSLEDYNIIYVKGYPITKISINNC